MFFFHYHLVLRGVACFFFGFVGFFFFYLCVGFLPRGSTGALGGGVARVTALPRRAADTVDRASVACLRMDVYTMLERTDRAVDVGLECLRSLGADWVDWSPHPTAEKMRGEYEQVCRSSLTAPSRA